MNKKHEWLAFVVIFVPAAILALVQFITALIEKTPLFYEQTPTFILLLLAGAITYWLSEHGKKQEQLNTIQNSIASLSGNVTAIEATVAMDYLSQKFGEASKSIKQAALAPS